MGMYGLRRRRSKPMKGVCLLFRQLEVHGFCKLIQLVFSKFDFDTETLHFQTGRFKENTEYNSIKEVTMLSSGPYV